MSTETTVLLLEADSLPSFLEEQLAKRDVFVEHASGADVEQMLPVIVPDVVVQPGNLEIESTLRAIQSEKIAAPLVVIADRARIRELREGRHEGIHALIPKDLPIAAIAHRLATMARRSVEGSPLEGGNAPLPSSASSESSSAEGPISRPPAERGSLAPAPLAPRQHVKIVDPEEAERGKTELVAREEAALRKAEAQERAVEEARQKSLSEAEERRRQAAERHRAEIEQRAKARMQELEERRRKQALGLDERKREQELKREERRKEQEHRAQGRASVRPKPQRTAEKELEQPTQAADIPAFAPKLEEKASERPKEVSPDFSSVKKKEDLSVIMPLPVDMRVDLAPQSSSLPIRLALLDTDLTRADAVAAELRERGMKIHPVTPDPGRTRWPMLRRFAPQGLVVDEKSMARGAAEWVETFRGDPFLRHVPVVLVRFSRVFDEAGGKVSLDPLLPMIEHVGREEFALLEKLGPGRRVDLWLSQITPYRLVEMLSKEDRNTRLDCRSENERMVWHLGPGYAGRGKLADLKTDTPKQRLSPSEALMWLLSHEDCQVAVHEHAEPLAHASESVDAEELLREMTEALGAPLRHESVRPGPLGESPKAPSVPDFSAFSSAPENGSSSTSASRGPVSAATLAGDLPIELAGTRAPFFSRGSMELGVARLRRSGAALGRGYATYHREARSWLRPFESKVPESALQHIPWIIPLALVLLLLMVISITSGGSEGAQVAMMKPREAQPESAPIPTASGENDSVPALPQPGDAKEETEKRASRWIVESDNSLTSCEERLGASAPKGQDPVRSSGYWKSARRHLMLGNADEALESMCLAGLFNPAGPASEGLAEYYLGQRSLKEAERWIKESLNADPERRKSKELLGDIENQKGNVKGAKDILLATMQLSGDETRKMEFIASKLQRDALLARKGGDLPRAERELRRAALLAPGSAEIAAELGDILLRREAPGAAALWAAHALQLDPNYATAMLLSGRVAEAQGKRDEARDFYEMVPLGDPYHAEAQQRRGRL